MPIDQELSAALRSGDLRGAAEQLVHAYADEVMGMCTAMVHNRATAEDLTQDVFGRAFANLGSFRGDASVRTWLLRIARNRCIDHLRAAKRDPWGGVALEPAEPDTQPDDAPLPPDLVLRRDDVHDALAQLAEGDRALVVLRFRNGLDYSELATAFGIKEGTVRMRVSRALGKMRRSLEAKHAELERAKAPKQASAGAPAPAAQAALGSAAPPGRELDAEEPTDAVDAVMADETDSEALTCEEVAPPAPAAPRSAPGFLARLTNTFRSAPPPPTPTGPPPEHPLTAFFAATWSPMSADLRTRLLARARLS